MVTKKKNKSTDLLKQEILKTICFEIEKRQLTQPQVSKIVGLTQPRISNLLAKKEDLFSIDSLLDVAFKLDLFRVNLMMSDPAIAYEFRISVNKGDLCCEV